MLASGHRSLDGVGPDNWSNDLRSPKYAPARMAEVSVTRIETRADTVVDEFHGVVPMHSITSQPGQTVVPMAPASLISSTPRA